MKRKLDALYTPEAIFLEAAETNNLAIFLSLFDQQNIALQTQGKRNKF